VIGSERLPNGVEALSDTEQALRIRVQRDFCAYAAECLTVRGKDGGLGPLVLNRAQRFVHERLEAQRAATGKVRALILKGRQQGISTLVGGRFFWRMVHGDGLSAFILTHAASATQTLFSMAARFHAHCPDILRPALGRANARMLEFSSLGGGYEVGTAGTRAVGRSKTIQLFHGSEVAFWPHASSHFAAVVQAVPDLPDTEVILESTAQGLGGEFFERWQQAEAGVGDYQAIFVPWFWQDEYRRTAGKDFVLDAEEAQYAAAHGLDSGQMAWRRGKIAELKDAALFAQEYPASAAEAFQTTGHESFISATSVLAARKRKVEGHGPLVGGADPARFGDDRFSVAFRRGRKVESLESRAGLDVVAGAAWLKALIDEKKPVRMFVDLGGIGAGVVDILRAWGAPYERVVGGVNFGGSPLTGAVPGPKNRRAEMWKASRDWLDDPAGVEIPDRDSLQADACAPGYGYDLMQRLVLEAKDAMKARGVRSPDEWDAVALTFAEPVREPRARRERGIGMPGGWMG